MNRRIARAAAVLFGSSVAEAGLGFLKNVLAAYYFGTSAQMDTYLLALLVPDAVISLARTGAFNFIPLFAEQHRQSPRQGWSAAGRMLTYWMVALLCALALAVLLTPQLTALVGPGLDSERRLRTAALTRVLLAMAGSVAAARIFAVVLVAERRFLLASGSDVVFQVVSLAYLVAFSSWGIEALAWGMVAGGFVQLLVVVAALHGHRDRIRASFDLTDPTVRRLVTLILPVYVANAGAKINNLVTRAFASRLAAGSISSLQYAYMLVDAPITVVAVSLTGALFPYLTQQFVDEDLAAARQSFDRSFLALGLLFVPLALAVLLLAPLLVGALLQRGTFDSQSAASTVAALRAYAPAIVPLALSGVVTAAFHARLDTTLPMRTGLLRAALNVAGCVLLVPRLGHVGIAVAATLSEYAKLAVLLAMLHRVFPGQGLGSTLAGVRRLLPAALLMAALLYPLTRRPEVALVAGPGRLLVLAALGLGGLVAYAAGLWVFSRGELLYFLAAWRDRRGSR